ncbi:spermatogenesis-associated protein 20 [Cladorrhinum samala]|uniref:Spermatogenesis-associated protein 20 n=1 Tax=Cladorrhinum samala TaxID=585594 RepID=A0AAV9HML9_9PEZI|nr:spermatogenesis-associated protein 20 [Cladorrhinum samala]
MMSSQLQREKIGLSAANAQPESSDGSGLRNRARESRSPYVRLHAETPVAWQPVDESTLALAVSQNKPIFMHIGFLADHLCHLSTQDSFSNPSVAELLNEHFIPIIVDREERPDLDTIYQNYSEAVNATGGWPLNLFLTPDLYPIFGGTYWPGPGTEHSLAGGNLAPDSVSGESYNDFLAIAKKIHTFWIEQEQRCRREAFEMLHKLQDFAQEGTFGDSEAPAPAASSAEPGDLDLDQLDEAVDGIAKMYDPVNGGFGKPKFPNPARLSFLLRLPHFPQEVRDVIGDKEVENAAAMAIKTLRKIRDGGIRDHIGAGFMRFSATSDWSMPHFEKMVAENALLLGVYLDAWLGAPESLKRGWRGLSSSDEFADVVFELADYLVSPSISRPDGGVITSEAADSYYRKGDQHKREGAYYLWTRREFDQVVGAESSDLAIDVAAAHWNVQEDGNVPQDQDPYDEFINQNVLSVAKDMQELSKQFGIPVSEAGRIVSSAREKLRVHRDKERVPPLRDEKVVAGVNGIVISALARTQAGANNVTPPGKDYIGYAEKTANFVRAHLWLDDVRPGATGKVLHRFWHNGTSQTLGFADDYAFLIEGLLDLYEATFNSEWLKWAQELQDTQTRHFYDSPADKTPSQPATPRRAYSGGFYSNESKTLSDTVLRLKSGMDKSVPSTNAVSASNLFRLGALLDQESYTVQAKETINAFEAEILQYPWLFNSLLTSVVTARLGVKKYPVFPDDEDALMRFYTLPRAEARAIIVEWEKHRAAEEEKRRKKEIDEEGGLKRKLEDMKI